MPHSDAIKAFQEQIESSGEDYITLDPLGNERARVQFLGPFEGSLTLWDATLMTLAAAGVARNTISIGEEGPNGRAIEIALTTQRIDHPTVLKTLMMVRQYKRLRVGRHEYGPLRNPVGQKA